MPETNQTAHVRSFFVSRITHHVSRITHHASRITHHASRFTPMDRQVEAEFLDELPATDPSAAQSRRDLQRLNAWMGNTSIMARELRSGTLGKQTRRVVEIGAGDGTFLLRVARRLGPEW